MGFAIPAATIRLIVDQLRASGKVNWSWTGLQLQPLRDFNRNMYFDATEGVLVAETDPASPARKAGLEVRDRIVRVGDAPVTATTEEDLPGVRRLLGLLAKDEPVALEVVRGDRTLTIPLTPREKGKVEGDELDCPRWDFTVKTINQFENPDLYFQRKTGVFIYGVKRPGNALLSGLRPQDILLEIDGTPVRTLDDVRTLHEKALAEMGTRHRLLVVALRNGLRRLVVLDYKRDFERR
jgi:serine protease Do